MMYVERGHRGESGRTLRERTGKKDKEKRQSRKQGEN